MIYPLITAEASRGLGNLTSALHNFVNGEAMQSFQYLGIGVGSLMLLFVVIYYIVSILDGGKFQVKMLLPILIFLFVCNFTWISKPVTGFTSKITYGLIASATEAEDVIYEEFLGNYSEDEYPRTIMGFFKYAKQRTGSLREKAAAQLGDVSGFGWTTTTSTTAKKDSTGVSNTSELTEWDVWVKEHSKSTGRVAAPSQSEIERMKKTPAGSSASTNVTSSSSTGDSLGSSGVSGFFHGLWDLFMLIPHAFLTVLAIPFAGFQFGNLIDLIDFLAVVLFWLAAILANVLGMMGAVMTALCVLFGPVTFAFALFPGGSSTVKTWFIRLCQFALYAPIAYMLRSLAVKCYAYSIGLAGFEASLVGVSAALVAIICLISTPSIASMIIEGAQGAVSLSSGLQSITAAGSAIAGIGGLAGGAWKLAAGQNNAVSNTMAGFGQMGAAGMVKSLFGKGADGNTNGLSGMVKEAHTLGQNARGFNSEGQVTNADIVDTLREGFGLNKPKDS